MRTQRFTRRPDLLNPHPSGLEVGGGLGHVVSPAQMREMDRITIEEIGVPGVVLMERAALAAVEVVSRLEPARVGLLCGGGNNGGDGLAMARLLALAGVPVWVGLLVPGERLRGDAAINLKAARGCGVEVVEITDLAQLGLAGACDVWVDALLGTGLDREVTGLFAQAVGWLNAQRARVVSVDIASGVHGETGQVLGCAVQADVTVTFGAAKLGCVIQPGRALCGALEVVDIGLPPAVVARVGHAAAWLTPQWAAGRLGLRPRALHKGGAGRVVVVGGSHEMTGALLLAARGAMVGGAGLVTAVTRAEVVARVAVAVPEVMAVAGIGEEDGALERAVRGADVVVVGPGMGQDGTAAALAAVLGGEAALVLDADALNLIASTLTLRAQLAGRDGVAVLTPHPGEMARLCGCSVAEVERAPVWRARGLAVELSAVVVLKLSTTIIAAPDGRLAVSGVGNPGMASAGMGDALSGLMGARLAEEADPFEAACLAVYQHGRAGDLAAASGGERALVASALLDHAGLAMRELEGTRCGE
jgi:ADP-dependent NAD(P)H-hydrate dehydratase / NAD(P)H-hydrate epimerase